MKKLLLTFFVSLVVSSTAYALDDNPYPSPWKDEITYGEQVGSKAFYGAKNLFLGWTELITEPMDQKTPAAIGQGLGNAVMDTVGGLLHLVTFPFTAIDVPLPENGVSLGKKDELK